MPVSASDEFDRLFERAASRLLLFVDLRLGPALRARVEPQDVLQDAYVAGLEGFGEGAPREARAFAAWMARIVENRLRGLADHFAARKRTPPGSAARLSVILDRVRAGATGPATAAARGDDHERLRATITSLPDEQREALLQRYFAGLEIDAIAAHMGRSASAVRRLLAKATARLGADIVARDGGLP